jgi:hypothetical protein
MTIQPLLTCALGLVLALLFEAAHAYVDKRWSTAFDKDDWFLGFWGMVVALLVCCRVMPLALPCMLNWVPFDVVVVLHAVMVQNGGSCVRRPGSPLPDLDSTPPTPPADYDGQDLDCMKNPKQDA